MKKKTPNLKNIKKKISEKKKKKKNVGETLEIMEKTVAYNKMFKIFFRLHQKLIKENQNQNLKKVLLKKYI